MADNRIAFGLCEQHNIKLPKDATPHDAWEALKEHGIVVGDDGGKSGTIVPGKGKMAKISFDYFGSKKKKTNTSTSTSSTIPPLPKEAFGFYDKQKLADHFSRHAADFACKTEKEYNERAVEFWNSGEGRYYYMASRNKVCKLGKDGLTFCCCDIEGNIYSFYKFKKKEKVLAYMKMDGWKIYE